MSGNQTQLAGRVEALREAFDRSFAQLPALEAVRTEDLLAIRVAGNPYALRVTEIAGLFADKVVVPVPSAVPELLGVSGLRGAIVPVYDLAALLGYSVHAATRWLVLARSREPVALAFDTFEAQLALSPQDVVSAAGDRPHMRGAVRAAGSLRPIAHLPSVLDEIHQRVKAARFNKKEA
jgi:purine-binding chemotaxis protein CheW